MSKSSRRIIYPRSARHGDAIAVFTYMYGITAVHKQGTQDVRFTPQRCITYLYGTLAVHYTHAEYPASVNDNSIFYFLWIILNNPYCGNRG